jgi:hypothetical protein
MMLLIDKIQSGKSGATEPSKNALLTIGILGRLFCRTAVIKKCDGVLIFAAKASLD